MYRGIVYYNKPQPQPAPPRRKLITPITVHPHVDTYTYYDGQTWTWAHRLAERGRYTRTVTDGRTYPTQAAAIEAATVYPLEATP